jgi:hypothetical protein
MWHSSLTEANIYYKNKVEKLEQELQTRNTIEEHSRQKIALLESQIKQLRETEITLRMVIEENKKNSARGDDSHIPIQKAAVN